MKNLIELILKPQEKQINHFCKNILKNKKEFHIFFDTLDAFEKELFYASLVNLYERKNTLHINNFAYAIRELIIRYLNRKSPEKNVKKSPWFNEDKVSRRHQVKYLIQKNISDDYFDDGNTVILSEIEECAKRFNKVFDTLNKLTHINEKTLKYDKSTGYEYIRSLFGEIFTFYSMAESLKNQLQEFLADYIESHLYDEIASEAIDAIDECSTHHLIEDTYIHDIIVNDIDDNYIYFTGDGDVSVEQQYGSSSDLRRGDGLIMNTSFPISFSGKVKTSDFSDVEIDSGYEVNNDSHYGIVRDQKWRRRFFFKRLYRNCYYFVKNLPQKIKGLFRKDRVNFDEFDF